MFVGGQMAMFVVYKCLWVDKIRIREMFVGVQNHFSDDMKVFQSQNLFEYNSHCKRADI